MFENSKTLTNALILAEQKFEKKRELAKRLADINARKREEKLAEDEDQLQKLLVAKDLFDDGDYEEFKEVIDEQSIPNYDELQVDIQNSLSMLIAATVSIPFSETNSSNNKQNR